jgi:hypothetical protein
MEFEEFPKIARLSRECTITEKIDGTNGCIFVQEDGSIMIGSRTRWITPVDDNFGFAKWVHEHMDELATLGPGRHFGEWWGAGIQRKYGQERKRFSLFNTFRWTDDAVRPACCDVVPILYQGLFTTDAVGTAIERLQTLGSVAAPGFMNAEGLIVYHHAAKQYFKKTLHKDDEWKGKAAA